MNKLEYISNLKNVKVILGNGFDLFCGLHTKYSDYFCKNIEKYCFVKKEYKKFKNFVRIGYFNIDERMLSLNIWDIFFSLNSDDNVEKCCYKWCDIEKLILSSLTPYSIIETDEQQIRVLPLISKINWNVINENLISNKRGDNDDDIFVIRILKEKMDSEHISVNDFYGYLLNQLKEFERDFGEFIYNQMHNRFLEKVNNSSSFPYSFYITNALKTLSMLSDINNIVSVDTFNYSQIESEKIKEVLKNING